MGTLNEDLTEIKRVEDTLTKNKVSRFAYTEEAYKKDIADGVPAYNIDNDQNIPIGTADIMKVNQTVIDRGYRAQASSITRMLLNHFLGRLSYNLNKVNDNVSSLLATLQSHLGNANGIASLDENGRVPYSQLPESAMELKGEWDASTNTPELVDGTGTNGDFYVVTVAGTQTFGGKSIKFQLNDRILYNGSTSTWIRLQAGGVYSVNEKTPDSNGNITLDAPDVNAVKTINNRSPQEGTGNINLESLCINGQNFNGSTPVSVDTMKMIYGGTGATSAKGAEFNITADMKSQTSDFTDTTKITCVQESPSASKGRFFYSNASYLWNYIKSKISSVLGLTATAYGGKASTAGNADKASFLDEYVGAGGKRLTSLNIVPKYASEYGGMRKDVVTESVTDGTHPGRDGHLLTMFWDNSGRYDSQLFVSNNTPLTLKVRYKANNADYGPWVDIITSNNIGSQTVITSLERGAYDHIVYNDASLLEWANCTNGSMKKVLIKSGTYNMTKGVNLSQAGTGYVLAENGAVIESHVPVAFNAPSGKTAIHNLKVVCDEEDNTCAFSANNIENLILYDCSAYYSIYTEIVNRSLFEHCTCYNCFYTFRNSIDNSFMSIKVFYQCRCYNCKCKQTIVADSLGILFNSESYFYKECHCTSCTASITISTSLRVSDASFNCYLNCNECVGCSSEIDVIGASVAVPSKHYGFLTCSYLSSCKEVHPRSSPNIIGISNCSYISSTTATSGESNNHVGNSCSIG